MGFMPAGVTEFLGLTDTPSSYSGQAGKVAAVNTGEDAMEFIDPPEHTTRTIACVEPQLFRPSTENAWEDFDLSKVVPEGATGAIFHLVNQDTGEALAFGLRKKGSTDDYHGSIKRHGHGWAIVGIDENRVCQGRLEKLGLQLFILVGYTGENFTFFTNGYNIVPAQKAEWVDTDLSSYCPGAIAAILEFANGGTDGRDLFGARKHGSTDDRHRGGEHTWMVVGVDANQHLDLYDQDWPNSLAALNLVGYITAGVTFYTNGHDISPAGDGYYHNVSLAGYLANPIIAFIELDSPYTSEDYAIRKNHLAADVYYDGDNHNFAIVHPNTPDSRLEIKLSHAEIHLYLLGIG